MDFEKYQKLAKTTAIYPQEFSIIYPALGLAGETGEIMEKIKKIIRDNQGNFEDPDLKREISKELGDVLWYIAMLATDFGLSLQEIAQYNIHKLQSRQRRGKLHGSGDNR